LSLVQRARNIVCGPPTDRTSGDVHDEYVGNGTVSEGAVGQDRVSDGTISEARVSDADDVKNAAGG